MTIIDPLHVDLWIVCGPAGSGKTTIAIQLARVLGAKYIEGDMFHPIANIKKMAAGQPLDDDDRWTWLQVLCAAVKQEANLGHQIVILSCSALKQQYRDCLRNIKLDSSILRTSFLVLQVSKDVLFHRLEARNGHFMKSTLLQSQVAEMNFRGLEEPGLIFIDGERSIDEVLSQCLDVVLSVGPSDASQHDGSVSTSNQSFKSCRDQ